MQDYEFTAITDAFDVFEDSTDAFHKSLCMFDDTRFSYPERREKCTTKRRRATNSYENERVHKTRSCRDLSTGQRQNKLPKTARRRQNRERAATTNRRRRRLSSDKKRKYPPQNRSLRTRRSSRSFDGFLNAEEETREEDVAATYVRWPKQRKALSASATPRMNKSRATGRPQASSRKGRTPKRPKSRSRSNSPKPSKRKYTTKQRASSSPGRFKAVFTNITRFLSPRRYRRHRAVSTPTTIKEEHEEENHEESKITASVRRSRSAGDIRAQRRQDGLVPIVVQQIGRTSPRTHHVSNYRKTNHLTMNSVPRRPRRRKSIIRRPTRESGPLSLDLKSVSRSNTLGPIRVKQSPRRTFSPAEAFFSFESLQRMEIHNLHV